jgi:hypothetical protein
MRRDLQCINCWAIAQVPSKVTSFSEHITLQINIKIEKLNDLETSGDKYL